MKVTRKDCEKMIERLNRRLNRPIEHWQRNSRDAEGHLIANVGHIGLDITSTGDGVTRYHVYEVSNPQGGENNLRNLACLGTKELYEFLCGIEVGLDLAKPRS